MLLMYALACLSLARPDSLALPRPAPPELPTQAAPAPHNAPRLVGQAVFAKQEVVALGPSTSDVFAVYTRDNTRPAQNPYVPPFLPPPRLRLAVCRLPNGELLWQQTLNADDLGPPDAQVADANRLYATLQLPRVSYDPMKSERDHYELMAFDWKTGQVTWRVPCTASGKLLALRNLVVQAQNHTDGSGALIMALDAATGQPRWQCPPAECNGLFAVNGLLYAYDESHDFDGPKDNTAGEYLNAYDPLTGKPVQKIWFYGGFRPISVLGSLAWFSQARRLVGTYALASVGIEQREVRAFDDKGDMVWNRPNVGDFEVAGDILVCQNSRVVGPEHNYCIPQGLIALDPATGQTLWLRKDLDVYEFNVCGSAVVVRSDRGLIGLDARTGKTAWKLALSAAPNDAANRPLAPQTKAGTRSGAKTASAGVKKGTLKTPEPTYTVRVYERYIAIAESGRVEQAATVRVYAVPQ